MTETTDPFSSTVVPFKVPEQFRAFAEKGVSQARDNYARFKEAAETNNATVEAVISAASKGATEYSTKLFEMMKANTSSAFDFVYELAGTKTPSEAFELLTSQTRKQVETFTAQAKELAELSRKVAAETAEPIKDSASKLFKPAA